MQNINLVLTFELADQTAPQIRGASRIKVGAQGLMVYDQDGVGERIDVGQLRSFNIQSISTTPLVYAA